MFVTDRAVQGPVERPGNGFGTRPLRQLPDRIPTPRDPARRYVFVTDRAVLGPVERPGNGFGKRPLRQLPDRVLEVQASSGHFGIHLWRADVSRVWTM